VTSAPPLPALRNAPLAFDAEAVAGARRESKTSGVSTNLNLVLHDGLGGIEARWRRFERVADCTPFQTFDWLAAWQRHIGLGANVRPLIAVASYPDGETAFILPLAVERRAGARRLCWLGQDLNDYNAPLIARDLSQRVTPDRFRAAWDELRARMQREPMLRHDWIELEKMPQTIGGQINPFFHLALTANPSGAHFARLGTDWKKFYTDKRSSATRRRDRAKRKHLSEFGEIGFFTCSEPDDVRRTFETLMEQKRRLLAHKGIANMFARPGWREFFLDIASNPATRRMVHVSRVQIGAACAAANLGLIFGNTYYHILASYDDGALAHYGPGALHLRELLAYAIGLRLQRFDFTIGDEAYKMEWSDTHVKLADYARAATWRGWPARCKSLVRRRLKRFIKQSPWAWQAVCRVRSRIGPLLRRPLPAGQTGSGTTARCGRDWPSSAR
jgi:CelD/BcsL family acetyltransferase involved in cellulose biosynthesis